MLQNTHLALAQHDLDGCLDISSSHIAPLLQPRLQQLAHVSQVIFSTGLNPFRRPCSKGVLRLRSSSNNQLHPGWQLDEPGRPCECVTCARLQCVDHAQAVTDPMRERLRRPLGNHRDQGRHTNTWHQS